MEDDYIPRQLELKELQYAKYRQMDVRSRLIVCSEEILFPYVELMDRAANDADPKLLSFYFEKFNNLYQAISRMTSSPNKKLDDLYEKALALSIPIRKLGYVYIIRRSDGLYKIGCTVHMGNRMRDLIREHGELEPVFSFQCQDHYRTERALHDTFAKKRIEGEWFSLNERDINQIKRNHKLLSGLESRIIRVDL